MLVGEHLEQFGDDTACWCHGQGVVVAPFQRNPAGRMHPDADAQGRGTSLMTHSAVNYQNGGKR